MDTSSSTISKYFALPQNYPPDNSTSGSNREKKFAKKPTKKSNSGYSLTNVSRQKSGGSSRVRSADSCSSAVVSTSITYSEVEESINSENLISANSEINFDCSDSQTTNQISHHTGSKSFHSNPANSSILYPQFSLSEICVSSGGGSSRQHSPVGSSLRLNTSSSCVGNQPLSGHHRSSSFTGHKLARIVSTLEKMLTEWTSESGCVRALLVGSQAAGKSTFAHSAHTHFTTQHHHHHKSSTKELESVSDSLSPPSQISQQTLQVTPSTHGGGDKGERGGGGATISIKLTDRDSVDIMFKRILQSDYEWEHKSVKVHLVELEKENRNLSDQSNFTKLYDNLDCAVVFIDASDPTTNESEFSSENFEQCYRHLARALPLIIVYNLKTNNPLPLPHPHPTSQSNNNNNSHQNSNGQDTNSKQPKSANSNSTNSSNRVQPMLQNGSVNNVNNPSTNHHNNNNNKSDALNGVKMRLREFINYEKFIMAADLQVLEVVVANVTEERGVVAVLSAILRQGTLRKCLDCGPNPKIVADEDIIHR